MIKMIDISRFFATTLDESLEFKTLCEEKIGEHFNYFVNVDLARVQVPIPYFGIVTFENKDDRSVQKSFETQILLGISRSEPITVGNITEEESASVLEEISLKAINIILKEMRTYGINSDMNIELNYINYFVPNPEGEEDLQMQIDIQLMQDKYLKC